jgi:hypothetical protein
MTANRSVIGVVKDMKQSAEMHPTTLQKIKKP